jgi:hypothetical protein
LAVYNIEFPMQPALPPFPTQTNTGLTTTHEVDPQREVPAVGMPDERDRKIVDLAKKCRALTISLNKSRANVAALEAQRKTPKNPSKKAPQNSSSGAGLSLKEREQQLHQASREKANLAALREATARLDAQRQKSERLALDNRRMRHVLIAEIGTEEDVDRILSATGGDSTMPTWKGRAQRIVVLKSKLKNAEKQAQQLQQGSFGGNSGGDESVVSNDREHFLSGGLSTPGQYRNIDDKVSH